MCKLQWKLLTKKRASSTQGVPPGKEALAWVTNTVTGMACSTPTARRATSRKRAVISETSSQLAGVHRRHWSLPGNACVAPGRVNPGSLWAAARAAKPS